MHAAAAALTLLAAGTAASAAKPVVQTGLEDDEALAELVVEALQARPELGRARAQARAGHARVSQAGAPPDPSLTLGMQNDGFDRLQIGAMETSYYSIGITQPLPFPGKLGLRADVAEVAARQTDTGVERAVLSTTAMVERAYVDLLLARARLELLGKLDALWKSSERAARARYEVGAGSQADLLRAQLERTRLVQRRAALMAGEQIAQHTLNRLRGRPQGEPIVTTRRLDEVPLTAAVSVATLVADAAARSPELAAARLATARATAEVALARYELLPDFSISAGVMPRGSLAPMWQVSLTVGLPVFAGSKQSPAIDESEARREAEEASEAETLQSLRETIAQRAALLDAARTSIALYRGGLLVQSEAAVDSAVAQYQVGKVPFTAVLEAQNGYFGDRLGLLDTVADALRLLIAQKELSLEPPAGLAGLAAPRGTAGGDTRSAVAAAGAAPAATPADSADSGARAMAGM